MITKRNGHRQTECRGCKNKGKFALNWDCFLYNFDNEPYCFDCLMEKLEQLQQENQELKEQNKKEFADYIKFKKEQYDEYLEKVNKFIKENQELKKQVKKLKRKIRKLKNKNYDKQDEFVIYLQKKKSDYAGANFPKDDLFDEVQEILEKYNEVTGVFDRWEKEVSSALDKDIENFIKEFYELMQKTTN